MADNYLNNTGLSYYHNRIKTLFASKDALDTLDAKVDEIVAEGGEPNVIETVQVNGIDLPVTDKTVNVEVPVGTSELTNDGDGGGSPFATESYVDLNGGKIDTIKVNGTEQTITAKAVDITVPSKTSELTNDSTYQTLQEVADAIDEAIAGVTQFEYEVVDTLPASGVKGTIYLVPDSTHEGEYDEYIWVEDAWQLIGRTGEIDLSDYWSKTELTAITTAEIDALFA